MLFALFGVLVGGGFEETSVRGETQFVALFLLFGGDAFEDVDAEVEGGGVGEQFSGESCDVEFDEVVVAVLGDDGGGDEDDDGEGGEGGGQ